MQCFNNLEVKTSSKDVGAPLSSNFNVLWPPSNTHAYAGSIPVLGSDPSATSEKGHGCL